MFVNFFTINKFFFFLYYYNWVYFVWTSLWLYCVIYFVFTNFFRHKFVFFFVLLLYNSMLGFLYNYDGVILLLLLAELMILFVFFLVYTQIYWRLSTAKKVFLYKYTNFFFLLSIILNFYFCIFFDVTTYVFYNFYDSMFSIVSNDFFNIYYFLFVGYPFVIISVSLLLGLFSIFFIFIYFFLKNISLKTENKKKNLYFLRKQTLHHQANFRVFLRTFQFN